MTIISKPETPTFIVSTPNLLGTQHPVNSVHGRIADVVGQDDDYDITQINPSGANDTDIITVVAGRFVVKSLEIGGSAVQTTIPINGDIVEFNGVNWINTPPKISGNFIAAAGPEAGEVLTFNGTNWVNFDIFALVENSIDNNIAAHALLTNVTHGLIDTGAGTLFHSDDGSYRAIAIDDVTGLTTAGISTDVLGADGTYNAVVHPVSSVFGRTNAVIAANNDYALAQIDGLIDSGPGTNVLFDDGTYKPLPGRRDVVSPSVADATTITQAFQTVFDFSPDTAFRNNNCLITIHYQAMNIGGPATWGVHLQSLIGFTVQQNAYGAGVGQTVNGSERAAFTATMEGVVSATGNIQIQSFAAIRDHDLGNSATNGKTRLTIELV